MKTTPNTERLMVCGKELFPDKTFLITEDKGNFTCQELSAKEFEEVKDALAKKILQKDQLDNSTNLS